MVDYSQDIAGLMGIAITADLATKILKNQKMTKPLKIHSNIFKNHERRFKDVRK